MPSGTPPLSNREKLAYGVGDSAANFVFQSQLAFLQFFYTDVAGISAVAAGSILLLSRFVDAFTDPVVGALADRTRSPWGHYRPWILGTALPLAAALVLCFTAPDLSSVGRIVWAIVTYNLLMIIYAANNVPYCALSGVITSDSGERTSLASWRFSCAMVATLVVTTFTDSLVKKFGQGDAVFGFQCTMGLWGVLGVLLFGVTFALTRERIQSAPRQQSTVRQDLRDLFRNGPWLALFLLAVLINVQLALRIGSTLYYFKYYMNTPPLLAGVTNFGLFNGVGVTVLIVSVFLAQPLSARFGKRRIFGVCLLLASGLMSAFVLVPRGGLAPLFALQILLQLCFAPTIPLLWAMMADVADYGHWKTGRRATALAFASIVFGTKVGLGIGAWLTGRVLENVGYAPEMEQTESALRGIVMLVSILPAAALLLGAGVLLFYRIDDRLEREIEDALQQRRDQTNGTD